MPTRRSIAALCLFAACSGAEPSAPRFQPLGQGVVHEPAALLWWTDRDSGRGLSWPDADRHCRSLSAGPDGGGWRLPTLDELASLYDASHAQPCGAKATCRVDPVIDLSSPYQWSATGPQPERRYYFDFSLGSQLAPITRPALTRHVVCTQPASRPGTPD